MNDPQARRGQCVQARAMAYTCARRLHLPREDVEDCASAFVLHLLQDRTRVRAHPSARDPNVWIRACAWRFALNFRRSVVRHYNHEASGLLAAVDRAVVGTAPTSESPEKALMAGEREEWLDSALEVLPPNRRALFLAHYAHGEDVAALASENGTTEAAMAQLLHRAMASVRGQVAPVANPAPRHKHGAQ